jgi:hypothetical protein
MPSDIAEITAGPVEGVDSPAFPLNLRRLAGVLHAGEIGPDC